MNRRKAKKGKASHFKYFQREAHKGSSLFYFVQKNEFNIFVGRSRCGGTHEAPGTAKRFDRIRLLEFFSLMLHRGWLFLAHCFVYLHSARELCLLRSRSYVSPW